MLDLRLIVDRVYMMVNIVHGGSRSLKDSCEARVLRFLYP